MSKKIEGLEAVDYDNIVVERVLPLWYGDEFGKGYALFIAVIERLCCDSSPCSFYSKETLPHQSQMSQDRHIEYLHSC